MTLTREQELFQTIVQKAWTDTMFKQALITDPVKAIKDFTGTQLNVPNGKTLVVKDQTDSSVIYINIPAQQSMDDVELTEDQLEIIAGGGTLPGAVLQSSTDPLNGMIDG